MPRIPTYRHHKPTGQALVELAGRRIYLGAHGTPESRERYERLIAEYLHNGRRVPDWATRRPDAGDSGVRLVNVMARYWEHAQAYYTGPDGLPTSTLQDVCHALRPLRKLYASTAAEQFGPKKLKLVRDLMVEKGWNRSTVNKRVKWIVRMFKWAAESELVPGRVWQDLKAVESLKRGRCPAPEPGRVRPVPVAHVDAIQSHVSPQVWALVQLQLLTGARGGELVIMRPIDLDMSGEVWLYRPLQHKTAYRGEERVIYLGPQAQAAIQPFLAGRPTHAYLFSPSEAEQDRRERNHAQRVTPLNCGNRPGTNRAVKPKRLPRDRYDSQTYTRAIVRGCAKADVPKWTAHQLRHTRATWLRARYGIEVARLVLGHNAPQTTELYAEHDHERAMQVMKEVG